MGEKSVALIFEMEEIRMKKIFSLILVFALMFALTAVPAEAASRYFSDVPSNHWAAYYIERAVDLGIMTGYSDGKFYPDKTLTRAEVAQYMYYMSPEWKNGETDYTVPRAVRDVEKKAWYYTGVAWLYDQMSENDYYGFRNPSRPNDMNNMSFRPDEGARRDFVVNMIRCLAGNYGYSFYDDEAAQKFKDYDSMSTFTRYSVAFAVERGLIGGYPNGYFDCAGTLTRAEAAKIFLAYYDTLMGQVYPNKVDMDYLYINNQTIGLFKSKIPFPDSAVEVGLYGDTFVFGRNSESVLACLADLPEQIIFTTKINGETQNYYVAKTVTFEKDDLFSSAGNPNRTCRNIFDAYYNRTQYDLAIMTYAGSKFTNGDTTHRVVVFAYKCY